MAKLSKRRDVVVIQVSLLEVLKSSLSYSGSVASEMKQEEPNESEAKGSAKGKRPA